MKKLFTDEFINRCNKIHNNFYDYSNTKYVNSTTNISIICPIHGEFKQNPRNHLRGYGCCKCANTCKKNTATIIKDFTVVHGDRYDYSNVKYKNNKEKVSIICKIHGTFNQLPSNHLQGKGCPLCNKGIKRDNKSVIDELKSINPNMIYTNVKYKNSKSKLHIECPKHGDLFITLSNFKKVGCKYCNMEKDNYQGRQSNLNFVSKCLNKSNHIPITKYKGQNHLVEFICKKHGKFKTTPRYFHKNIESCKKCSNIGISQYEKSISEFINNNNKIGTILSDREILNGKEIDIFIPSKNLGIEFNGLYWHSSKYKDKKFHINKTLECNKKGIQLIHIFEDEWVSKEEIVKSRLLNILGETKNRIFARKTIVKEVDTKVAMQFLQNNHLQGKIGGKIKLGLYYKNNLVSLMTFGNLRKNLGRNSKKDNYELLRFCNILNTTVIGGAGKLFKYFINEYAPEKVISYADIRWSNGNLYEKLGFKFIRNTEPNYFYVVNKIREGRFKYRKSELVKQGFDINLTEKEIMYNRGIYRIYDCGSKLYEYNVKVKI